MKIAFIGTHATGKTTLSHQLVVYLKSKGLNAGHVHEIVRDCPFPVNEEATLIAQKWVILNQIINEDKVKFKYNHKLLVCDRSVLDNYAYLYNTIKKHPPVLKSLTFDHLKTYDILFLTPINEKYLKDDGFRSVDKKFQLDIDNALRSMLKENSEFLKKNNVFVFEINNFEEVKEKVDEFLKSGNLLK